MKTKEYHPEVIEEDKPKEAVNEEERRQDIARSMAFQKIGGVPSNFFRSTVTRVNGDSYRVNIYTQEDKGQFMKAIKIEHSFFLTI